ncbi:MAG TPA: PQQ-binding-like beta-propeller repeat protein [Blastocatellia bacterium]|nr:PQQ-binding-like beta-propeller repeat protein [Blastocatellia bacterium]
MRNNSGACKPRFKSAAALSFSIVLTLISLSGTPVFAEGPGDQWMQFRGPNGTGISASKGLPVEFSPTKNVVWKTPLPPGHSSPVLGRDRIFLTGFESNRLWTICLDKKTGRLLWQREVPRNRADRLQKPNNPASPSPVTDGENVFAFFQDFGLLAYDKNGKERWRVPLGPFNSYYGLAASPILVDDVLVLPCDQDTNSFMLAVDRKTGRVRWRIDRPEVISGYSTPIVYRPREGPAQIVLPESFQLSAYSAATGERVWWVRGLACEMKSIPAMEGDTIFINGWGWPENQPGKQIKVAPFEEVLPKHDADRDGKISKTEAPDQKLKQEVYFNTFDLDRDGLLNARDWQVYRAMMSAENGLLAIKLGGRGDMTESSIRWRYQRPVPQVPSTLLYRGVLYMVNDSGVLISFDPATGGVLKQGRLEGAIDKYFASPVAADDKVYLVSEAGHVSVLKPGGDWQILAVNNLDDECYATPAISDGRIYIRTRGALYCFAKVD